MSQTIQADASIRIESIARRLPAGAQEDFRALMNEIILANLTALSPGGNLIRFGGSPAGSSAPPTGVTHTVSGANAVYTIQISHPPTAKPGTIYHEISYSPVKSFVSNLTTTLEPTTDTTISIPAPGATNFFRLRASFDKKTWSPYQLASTEAIDAGLVESSTMAPGAAFNQTNYAIVSSQSATAGETITINGPGGNFTPYTAIRGAARFLRPSATIVGTLLGPTQFVGWDGQQFHPAANLAQVLADDLEPVGQVVIGGSSPGGGGVVGGNGGRLTQDPTTVFGVIP